MKLSIITICRNDCSGLKKTALSIISQTYTDFEWIIVDGASTDGSVDIIKETLAVLDSNNSPLKNHINWKSEPDNGIYNAMNKGIKQATGDYLLFINSGDCIYDKNVLKKVIPMLNGIDVYVGDLILFRDGISVLKQFPRTFTLQELSFILVSYALPHQASFIKATNFKKYGLYREDLKIVSDWFYFYEIIIFHNASISVIPEVISIMDGSGVSSSLQNVLMEWDKAFNLFPNYKPIHQFYQNYYLEINWIIKHRITRVFYNMLVFIHHKGGSIISHK